MEAVIDYILNEYHELTNISRPLVPSPQKPWILHFFQTPWGNRPLCVVANPVLAGI